MRFLKIYGGAILILLSVAVLYFSFTNEDLAKETYNWILVACLAVIILGVIFSIVGGKIADKIGSK